MLSRMVKRGLLTTNPAFLFNRWASTKAQQHTVLVVLYEGLILNY